AHFPQQRLACRERSAGFAETSLPGEELAEAAERRAFGPAIAYGAMDGKRLLEMCPRLGDSALGEVQIAQGTEDETLVAAVTDFTRNRECCFEVVPRLVRPTLRVVQQAQITEDD